MYLMNKDWGPRLHPSRQRLNSEIYTPDFGKPVSTIKFNLNKTYIWKHKTRPVLFLVIFNNTNERAHKIVNI